MVLIDFIGAAAGVLTSASYLPQIYKIWKTKSAGDISTTMFVGLYIGICLWLWYSVLISAPHMLVANCITLLLMTGILALKYRFRNAGVVSNFRGEDQGTAGAASSMVKST
jgi:MtN3 and saliva related transmembrane protein